MKRFSLLVLPFTAALMLASGCCAGRKPVEPAPAAPTELDVTLKAKVEPVPELREVSHDASSPRRPGEIVGFSVRAVVPEGHRLMLEVAGTAWKPSLGPTSEADRYSGSETVPAIPPGKYDVVATLLDPSGAVAFRKSAALRLDVAAARSAIAVAEERLRDLRAHFAYDSSAISPDASREIEAVAAVLRTVKDAGCGLVVEGHCDERGTANYNIALSQARARSALDHLASLGAADVARSRMIPWGEEKPLVQGSDETAWAQNRRVEFRLENCPSR